jgi:hypothetical protein
MQPLYSSNGPHNRNHNMSYTAFRNSTCNNAFGNAAPHTAFGNATSNTAFGTNHWSDTSLNTPGPSGFVNDYVNEDNQLHMCIKELE